MARILVAEDERLINELIAKNLRLVGHDAVSVYDGAAAWDALEANAFDMALVDIMMPEISGFDLIDAAHGTPVVFVTAKADLESRVRGLNLGADDYIVKPFEVLELLARVEAVLRRTQSASDLFVFEGLSIDRSARTVTRESDGCPIALTPREFDLLDALVTNRNWALSREKLLELVWGADYKGDARTVDTHIQRLRKKLGWESAIETVYKLGYRLNAR